ncbi:hypothetical protein CTI12_AA255770 [Artemisia annua]|uniref:C-JID domain-containing protein n=1 Tax=Artemisia annua TaxID=35608 RepID=A0A2U1NK41_ARTAN|nr:hypothetical protein CTI12_AA255770 [Artemisia annua]
MSILFLDIVYHGDGIPEWFTNRSTTEHHVKVELPSNWCFNKFRGYGTCVVFKGKNPCKFKGYSVKNFDGAYLSSKKNLQNYHFQNEVIGIQDSYMIWLHYTSNIWELEEAKNFLTFGFEENNEDVEVKECGVRLICDEDIEREADWSMLQGLPTPTQHGATPLMSNMLEKDQTGVEKIYQQLTSLKDVLKVADVAEAVLFFACRESGFITGHDLVIDGGFTL